MALPGTHGIVLSQILELTMIFQLRILPTVPIWTALIFHLHLHRHYLRPHLAVLLVNSPFWTYKKCLCFTRTLFVLFAYVSQKSGNYEKMNQQPSLSANSPLFWSVEPNLQLLKTVKMDTKTPILTSIRCEKGKNEVCYGRFLVPPSLENKLKMFYVQVG